MKNIDKLLEEMKLEELEAIELNLINLLNNIRELKNRIKK
jgi:hypothetical protein